MTNYITETHTLNISFPVIPSVHTWDGYNAFSGSPAPNGNYLVQSSIKITQSSSGACEGDEVSQGYNISIPQ